jgi:hypothetical protein
LVGEKVRGFGCVEEGKFGFVEGVDDEIAYV